MRTLLLLRGAMGSGKSTFIKENNLEPYTLEADKFRVLVSNPVMNEEQFIISQKNDNLAWDMLLRCLEERMKRGDFTVIDATHSSRRLTKKYEALADLYKYSIYYYQTDATIEQCLEWNRNRPAHKFVPEDAIKRAHSLVNTTELPKRYKRIYSLDEIKNFYVDDVTEKYEKVKVAGDIHSCGTALEKYLENFDEKTLYVFCGDYFDRGIEHNKVWSIVKELVKKPNVIMLEGNHEKHIRNWAYDIEEVPKSALRSFSELSLEKTDKEVENLKKEMRMFYKKLRQAYAFNFNGRKFLVTHGGISFVPDMVFISANEMIKGVGNYETEIDQIYEENFKKGKCQDFIQIHGHRMTESAEHSICLEGEIEYGGHLKYVEITPETYEPKEIKNDVYDKYYLKHNFEDHMKKGEVLLTSNEEVNIMLNSNLIKVKKNDFNTYSMNFTEKVFRKRIWDDLTIKARGLYVDRETGEVKARSYNKFFNIYQTGIKEVSKNFLMNNLKFPLKAITKYNGFLGILSVDKETEEFIFATKSTMSGDHAGYFRKIFEKLNKNLKNYLKEILLKNNASATFEVISSLDPHIVKYDKDELFLLDFIENKLHINGIDIDEAFSEEMKMKLQNKLLQENISDEHFFFAKIEKIIETFEELEEFNKKADELKNIEGYVYKDQDGFMFKYKNKFYNDWKRRRGLIDVYKRNPNDRFDFSRCRDAHDVVFMNKVTELPFDEIKDKSIIEIRDMVEKANG
jgi:2,3-cyclic nucleotide 3-phosphodiesterase